MTPEIQQRLRTWIGGGTLVLLAFWSYGATNYLRLEYEVNPVAYDNFDVVVLGDSITEGLGSTYGSDYVSLLREHTGVKIRNSGIRNHETVDALARIQTDVIDHDPDIAIVLLGGNDYIHRVPEETTFANLEMIVDRLTEENIQVLLLGVSGGVYSDKYRDHFDALAEEKNIAYIPNVLEGILGKSKHLKDPLHPNDMGHRFIFERVAPELDRLLEIYY